MHRITPYHILRTPEVAGRTPRALKEVHSHPPTLVLCKRATLCIRIFRAPSEEHETVTLIVLRLFQQYTPQHTITEHILCQKRAPHDMPKESHEYARTRGRERQAKKMEMTKKKVADRMAARSGVRHEKLNLVLVEVIVPAIDRLPGLADAPCCLACSHHFVFTVPNGSFKFETAFVSSFYDRFRVLGLLQTNTDSALHHTHTPFP